MSNKRFDVIIKRTYTTRLLIEAPSKEYINDMITSEDSVEEKHLDNFWETLAHQELKQMDVDMNDWEIKEVEIEKPHLIID